MGFGQGLSGLNAASQSLDIIGNNIANSGTVGFKASQAAFADVYATSRVGLGTQVAAVNQRFTIGTVSTTGNQFDMAIDGANGFFRLEDSSGVILYSRNGQFHADKDNFIVNAQGHRLTGIPEGGAAPQPITVPVGNIDPYATDEIKLKANFDANSDVIPDQSTPAVPGAIEITVPGPTTYVGTITDASGTIAWVPAFDAADAGVHTIDGSAETVTLSATGQLVSGSSFPAADDGTYVAYVPAVVGIPFDPNNGDSFTHMQPVDVYDSLGNAHTLTQYFVKRAENGGESQWDVYFRMDGMPVASPADGATQMNFDAAGRLTSNPNIDVSVTNVGGAASPAEDLAIRVSLAGSTQFGGEFSPSFTQTGYPTGEYSSLSIDKDGSIVARYTNGENRPRGYIVLADFKNLQGLQPVGGNAWQETSASGQPVVGQPGSNGLATIMGQSVEESNVDMGQELVDMIIAQRTYQANAQTIKTQDQILQTLITLR